MLPNAGMQQSVPNVVSNLLKCNFTPPGCLCRSAHLLLQRRQLPCLNQSTTQLIICSLSSPFLLLAVRIFTFNGGHSRDVYHTKRMQRVFAVRLSGDGTYVFSGEAPAGLVGWQGPCALPAGVQALLACRYMREFSWHAVKCGNAGGGGAKLPPLALPGAPFGQGIADPHSWLTPPTSG